MKRKDIIPTSKELLMRESDFIVSKTDLTGRILYGNEIFIEFSGYSEEELIGSQHNIIRHPDMPRAVFYLLWDYLAKDKEIFALLKTCPKMGGTIGYSLTSPLCVIKTTKKLATPQFVECRTRKPFP